MRLALLVLGILFSGVGHCLTGNELIALCRETANPSDRAHCLGYIDGVTDGHSDAAFAGWAKAALTYSVRIPPYGPNNFLPFEDSYCFPSGVTLGQLRGVVSVWMRDNPAHTHKNAAELIRHALEKAFPCPKR